MPTMTSDPVLLFNLTPISFMLYADDLSLTANEPDQLQMLDRLSAYALRKGLIVNTSKSKVVHLN